MFEAVLGWRRDGEHGEVTDEPRRHGVPTTAGRGAGGTDRHVVDLLPEQLLTVVHAAEVLELAQQLDGRLRSVRVLFGHVEIVEEDDHALTNGRTWTSKRRLR